MSTVTTAPAWPRAALAWTAAAAVLVVSLAPLDVPAAVSDFDKLVHVAMYATLMYLFARAHARGSWLLIAALLAAYGGLIEGLQHFAPQRFASWADAVANAAGISIMLTVLLKTAPNPAPSAGPRSGLY